MCVCVCVCVRVYIYVCVCVCVCVCVLTGYVHAVLAVNRLSDTVTRWRPSFRVEMIKLKGSVTCGEVGVGLLLQFLSSVARQLYRVTTGLELRRGGRDGNDKNELFVKREPLTEM